MAMELLGTRVVRGRDWEWDNQDGGEGCVGTVVQIGQDDKSPFTAQLVWIQWDCGTKANYRAGFDGKHDLRVFETRNQGEIYRYFIVFPPKSNSHLVAGKRENKMHYKHQLLQAVITMKIIIYA